MLEEAASNGRGARQGRAGPGGGEGSLREAAYRRIEDLLNTGGLRPGQIISQRELVAMTGTTLGSVREAVPRFEAEGLLKTLPQRGLMVPSLDVAFVRDAYQMRHLIELAAFAGLVEGEGKALVTGWIGWHEAALEQIAGLAAADQPGFLDRLQRYDWQMHATAVQRMGNRLIANVYRVTAIKIRMAAQQRIQVTFDNANRVIAEHLAILHPLAKGDAEGAQAALGFHLENSLALALGGQARPGPARGARNGGDQNGDRAAGMF